MTLSAPVAVLLERDVVVVEGPEAGGFLHGQVSQDIESLTVGESRLSLLLEPRGRLEVFFRVTRAGEALFVLDTDPGFGESLCASLERFKLRTRAEFSRPGWSMLAVRGPGATAVEHQGSSVVAEPLWHDVEGIDLLGEAPLAPAVETITASDFARSNALAGLPVMGVDVLAGDVPNDTGLVDVSVSFTKGCYRGQELVERIDARSGGRRSLRRYSTPADVSAGMAVEVRGETIGEVRSAVRTDAGTWGFALVAADVDHAAAEVTGSPVELTPLFG
jgi:folate-binding protein YgfZ